MILGNTALSKAVLAAAADLDDTDEPDAGEPVEDANSGEPSHAGTPEPGFPIIWF